MVCLYIHFKVHKPTHMRGLSGGSSIKGVFFSGMAGPVVGESVPMT